MRLMTNDSYRKAGIVTYAILLVFFLFVLPTYASTGDKSGIVKPKHQNPDRHERAGTSARQLIEALSRGGDITTHLDALDADAVEIENENQAHLKRFEHTGKRLNSIAGIPTIVARHEQALQQFRQKSSELKVHFDKIRKSRRDKVAPAELSGQVRELHDYLEQHRPRKEFDIKSTDSGLPWHMVQPGDLRILGDISQASQQGPPPAVAAPVADDDLSATIDVQITPEIRALAASLSNSPLEIFRHVYNNYNYTPYHGSMKGSLDTFWEKEGNDYDLASLLVSLLRAANIPARYVRADIIVPIRNIQAWVGIDDPLAAARYLAGSKIPCSFYTSGSAISHVQLEHVYVEAYIPYGNYRGTGEDDKGKAWVPMDPSFKKYKVTQRGVDLGAAMAFDWKGFSNDYLGTLQNITPLAHYTNRINAYIAATYPGKTIDDLKRTTELSRMKFDFLPNTLPYRTYEIIERYSAIPPNQRHTIRFTIPEVLDYSTSLPEVSGRRITLTFNGATTEDQATIDQYGGIFKTPPYLIKVVPYLRINGIQVALGNTQDAGIMTSFTVGHSHPDGTQDTFSHNVTTGSHNAVGLTTGKVRPEFLSIAEVEPSAEVYLPKMLHSLSMKYHNALNQTRQALNDTMRMQSRTYLTEALVSTHEERTLILGGIPTTFALQGFQIDAKEVSMAALPVDGKDINRKQIDFAMTFGFEASYQENRVFEESMFWVEGTSAVKGLQMLTAFGIQLDELEPNSTYANANLPDGVLTDINNALNMGWRVIAPQDTGGLPAVPYIKYDDRTGSAGFMIATAAGGLAQETIDLTVIKDLFLGEMITLKPEIIMPQSPHQATMGDAFLMRLKVTAQHQLGERAIEETDVVINTDWQHYKQGSWPMYALIPGSYSYLFSGAELFKFNVWKPVNLTIDSDNSSGLNPDGTYSDPKATPLNELMEDNSGLSGKIIPLNNGDTNTNGIPDYADGFDLGTPATDNASAPFVPMLLEIPAQFDLAQTRIRFSYANASDPGNVTATTDANGKTSYMPAPGHIRLWSKDGGKARKKSKVSAGGDYIESGGNGVLMTQLGPPLAANHSVWRIYIEGIAPSSQLGEEQIAIEIDPDGDGPAPFKLADKVRATVVKPLLVTDYNRDRTIDGADKALAAQGKTFYFWVNDDTDSGDISLDTDMPRDKTSWYQTLNGKDDKINGTRDLEDFFPVHLDIQEQLQKFPPTSYKYILKQADSALNFAFASLKPGDSGKYLTDASDGGIAKGLANKATFQIKKEGVVLNDHEGDKKFLQNIMLNNTGVILVEGRDATSKSLVLDILDKNGKLVLTSSFNISIAGVEQMFRHKNLIQEMYRIENGLLPPVSGVAQIIDHPVPPDKGSQDRLGNDPNEFIKFDHFKRFDADNDGTDFVFVHGLNINGDEARGAQAGIFKRLFWSGSRARFWGVTWYGWDSQANYPLCFGTRAPKYHHNVRHAYNAGILLKNFINSDKGPGKNATITGHSLGNVVVSNAIQKGMDYGRYFMVNAAVAEEAYIPDNAYSEDDVLSYEKGSSWYTNTRRPMYHPAWRYPNGNADEVGYNPFLWASEWYTLFDGDDVRSTLTWRDYFEEVRTQAKVFTFFSPTDEAFKPFNYNPLATGAPTDPQEYPANVTDWPGFEDVLAEWLKSICFDEERLGNYAWSMQELLKGRMTTMEGFTQGGWGVNKIENTESLYNKCVTPPDSPMVCNFITPQEADMLEPETLKTEPLFSKNPDNAFLYASAMIPISPDVFAQKQMELLANEIPALTFAAGHRGVKEFAKDNNIDIRNKYLSNAPWPRKPLINYEWRHNDIYNVAYPYTYQLFDDFVLKMK